MLSSGSARRSAHQVLEIAGQSELCGARLRLRGRIGLWVQGGGHVVAPGTELGLILGRARRGDGR